MYKETRWKTKRAKMLRRDKYLCQYYKRYGKRIEAQVVHHIYPVEQYPEYAYEEWNLISLAHKAHNKMHDRDGHRLSAEGERLKQATPHLLREKGEKVKYRGG